MILLSGSTREARNKMIERATWRRWWAWFPVVMECEDNTSWALVWLCWVERKPEHCYTGICYRYREIIK